MFLSLLILFTSGTLAVKPLPVYEYSLKNGLKVLVYVDSSAPVVSTQLWYKVGSYYEPSGITGISHLLEHMGFKGTKRIKPGEYWRIIHELGGEANAFTSELYTAYYANLASDRYEIAIDLESDRMRNLILDTLEFNREKQVVMEERRLGENSPGTALWEQFFATAYLVHPFRNPVIGWMNDLERITRDDVYNYYRSYYTPQNAILVIAGSVNPEVAYKKAEKYFSKIKSSPAPLKDFSKAEPPQKGERRFIVRRKVSAPMLMLGFHTCDIMNPDYYALEVLERILLTGKSSRLQRKLVYEQGKVLSIFGGNDTEKDPGIFYLFLTLQTVPKQVSKEEKEGFDYAVKEVEEAIYQELEVLKQDTVNTKELERVKNQVISNFVFAQDRIFSMGAAIARSTITTGSYKFFENYPEMISKVTKDDIRRVVNKYFFSDNRTVGILLPADE